MRKILTICLLTLLSLGLLVDNSYAKRFGGGKSFGAQRSASYTQQARSTVQSATNTVSNKANRWLGPIAGLITGGLLASLFMGHGLGTGLVTWLILAVVAFAVISFIRNRMQPSLTSPLSQHKQDHQQPSNQSSFFSSPSSSAQPIQSSPISSFLANPQPIVDYPKDFNADNFLRDAKAQFIRLQAAYDQKNLQDLRQFTTPEIFAEIQLQLHERGQQVNHTEVIQLEAMMLEAITENDATVASVRFSGLIKESPTDNPHDFIEIWHFRKDNLANAWQVAGIQQTD